MSRFPSDFDVAAHQAKVASWRSPTPTPRVDYVPARTRRRGMNALETSYARHLETLRRAGEIQWWAFEPMRLKLAHDTYFRPDFGVLTAAGLSFHETKGFVREAARVRLNVAAATLPFPFYLVRKKRQGFDVQQVEPPGE